MTILTLTFFRIVEAIEWISDNWEVIGGALIFAGLVTGAVYYLRSINSRTTNATQLENIDALTALIKTRDTTIKDRDDLIALLRHELDLKDSELAAVRSEYKIISGIIIADLIRFQSDRLSVTLENEKLKSETRIFMARIDALEKRCADCPG